MREDFLEVLRQFENVDLSETPNYRFMVMFAKADGGNYPNPNIVASQIKIKVNEDFINDQQLVNQTLKTYISCLNKIWKALLLDFGWDDASKMFPEFVKDMSITCTL